MLEIKEDKTITDLGNYQSLVEKEILNTKEITVINKTTGKNITIRDDSFSKDTLQFLYSGVIPVDALQRGNKLVVRNVASPDNGGAYKPEIHYAVIKR